MKRLIGTALALALSGCDTISGIKYDFDSGSFTDRTTAIAAACAARMRDPGLDAIRGKVELFKSPPDGPVPFPILTDNAAASQAERPAIGIWASTMEDCQAKARRLIDKIPLPAQPTQSEVDKLTSYITDAWVDGSRLRVALYSGQITYADYANKRLTLAQDALKTAERYAQDMDEENETQDLEKVEAALAPFASMM